MQIEPAALEESMRSHTNCQHEIPGWSAKRTRLTMTRQADAIAIGRTGRDAHGHGLATVLQLQFDLGTAQRLSKLDCDLTGNVGTLDARRAATP